MRPIRISLFKRYTQVRTSDLVACERRGFLARGAGALGAIWAATEADRAIASAPYPAEWSPTAYAHALAFDMASKHTGQRYRIVLGLPHAPAPAEGLPVLWALDGLASFPLMEVERARPARVGESAAWRQQVGKESVGLIVAVGYASGDPFDINARARDYTPVVAGRTGDAFSTEHGGAEAFLRFLVEELRPHLAQHFPMDAQRHTLFGFSYGGLFTAHTLSTQPQHFQRYWAASPSLWFGEHHLMKTLSERLRNLHSTSPVRVMVTVGEDEQYPAKFASPAVQKKLQERTMVDNVLRFAELVRARELPQWQVQLARVPGHDHLDMLFHGARRVLAFAFA